jgi:antitoxin MazE
MVAKVQKWGNSLAIRIPKPFASEIGLTDNSAVTLSLQNQKIVISPIARKKMRLKQILDQITEQNLHDEIDMGIWTGNEIW